MAQVNAAVVALQLERVAPLVPMFYEIEDALCSRLSKTPSLDQSTRDLRLPIPMKPGGKFRQGTFDGGDMGRGSAEEFAVATLAPIAQWIALEWTDLVDFATDTSEKAVAKAVTRVVASGMKEFKTIKDRILQTAGNGVLAVTNSTPSGNSCTLASPFYAQGLRYNQEYQVYDTTLATNRGQIVITDVNYATATITFTGGTPAGMTSGDKLLVSGLSGASPVSLFGLQYHHNNATSGTWLSLSRATYSELRTPSVNASSSALVTLHPQLLFAKMEMALGQEIFDSGKWFWYGHTGQKVAWTELGQLISEISLNHGAGGNGNIDFLLQRKKMNMIGGVEFVTSINADRTRIDLIDGSNWMRGTYKETGLHKMGGDGGGTALPVYGGSGGYGTATLTYISNAEQYAVKNTRRGGYVYGLLEVSGL